MRAFITAQTIGDAKIQKVVFAANLRKQQRLQQQQRKKISYCKYSSPMCDHYIIFEGFEYLLVNTLLAIYYILQPNYCSY